MRSAFVSSRLIVAALALASWGLHAQTTDAASQLERGKYLATAADCVACHTNEASKPYAGAYPVATPLGTIYSTNLTPDKETGIGEWTDDEFARALHEGIGRHGEQLYPAMPYDLYTQMTREDALAIKAYLFSLPPIHQPTPADALPFPFNQRWIMAGWKLFNFRPHYFAADASKDANWNRGAYLVNALEHCGSCHTPRNLTQGMKAGSAFGGSQLAEWEAYNISADPLSGVGAWSDEQLFTYLKTGHVQGKASVAGPMAEAVENSLSKLTDDDLHAIVTYLRTVPAVKDDGVTISRAEVGAPADDEASLRGGKLSNSNIEQSGAELYSGACASCHASSGQGATDGYYPSLFHNSTVGAPNHANLVAVILEGVHYRNAHDELSMPAFAEQLDDAQVASLATYLIQRFGQGGAVDAAFVHQQRHGGPPSNLMGLVKIGMVAALFVLLLAIIVIVRAIRRRRTRY